MAVPSWELQIVNSHQQKMVIVWYLRLGKPIENLEIEHTWELEKW